MKTINKVIGILIVLLIGIGCSKDDHAAVVEPPGSGEEVKTVSISEINPVRGPQDTEVTIRGNNFGSDANQVEVFFNEKIAIVEEVTNTQIKAIVPQIPAYAAGTDKVIVRIANVELDGPEFTYLSLGHVSTYSGSSVGEDDGTLELAKYSRPIGITMDNQRIIYVADTDNNRIRRITPDGFVTTLAGGKEGDRDGVISLAEFDSPRGIAVDEIGTVYIADFQNHKIKKITNVGVVVTLAGSTEGYQDGQGSEAKFSYPEDIALDAEGNVYVADGYNNRIRKITPDGMVTTLAGGNQGYVDGPAHLAQFYYPSGLASDIHGNLFVVDEGNHRIRKISPDGKVTTLAGSDIGHVDGLGEAAQFQYPNRIAVDVRGNAYVTDLFNYNIRKISATGYVSTLAGGSKGDVDGIADEAQFNATHGIVLDEDGNIFVADTGNNRIRKITQE